MFLSIIVPVYNAERYLSDCLDSLVHQDINCDDYEIICVDDGSTDGSNSILKKYCEEYSNIITINRENGGVSAARNTGMEIVRGDYLWFIDSDDFIQTNILSELFQRVKESNKDEYLFHSYFFWEEMSEDEKQKAQAGKLQSNEQFSGLCTRLISKKLIGDTRFPVGIKYGEDIIFIRELELLNPTHEELERVWHYYRMNAYNTTNRKNNYCERAEDYMAGAVAMDKIYNSANGANEANANILMNHIWLAMWSLVHLEKHSRNSLLEKWKRQNMFPYKRPSLCTTTSAHLTIRMDLIGRIFDILCTHSNTIIGYRLLLIYTGLRSLRGN